MSLSIVITTYNRSAGVQRLLASLGDQTYRDFQVVVAIDGSTDDTEQMLASLRPGFDLKWVNTHCPGYGLAVARNKGILAADGKVVAVIDDDSYPEPGFAQAHHSNARPGVITGGPRLPSLEDDAVLAAKARKLARLPALQPMRIDAIKSRWPDIFLIENNISMRREDWIAMGMFSERLKLYGYIGQEFFARAEFLRLQYQYAPEARVIHHGEHEGDNGFLRSRKRRQARLAALIRPTLMQPQFYEAQRAWAQALAQGLQPPPQPGFGLHAAAALPWRFCKSLAQDMRRSRRRA